jgi:L-cysteine S-thiosulfotransferase
MKSAPTIAAALLLVAADIAASPLAATEIPQAERRSGYSFMAPDTKAIQDDDTANPGMLWVLDGETLWKSKTGAADKACADCHDDARVSMKGVAAR